MWPGRTLLAVGVIVVHLLLGWRPAALLLGMRRHALSMMWRVHNLSGSGPRRRSGRHHVRMRIAAMRGAILLHVGWRRTTIAALHHILLMHWWAVPTRSGHFIGHASALGWTTHSMLLKVSGWATVWVSTLHWLRSVGTRWPVLIRVIHLHTTTTVSASALWHRSWTVHSACLLYL